MRYTLKTSLCAGLSIVGFALAAPSFSQTVEELTVTGRIRDLPSISRAVSYADLDLTTGAGQDTLKTRVKDTAKDLCTKLGESSSSGPPLVPTCEQAAVADAMKQVNTAIASATPRTPPAAAEAAPAPSYAPTTSAAPKAARN